MTNHTNDERTVHCPVEECDEKGPGTSLASVRSHIVASPDDAHDWDEFKTTVESQEAV